MARMAWAKYLDTPRWGLRSVLAAGGTVILLVFAVRFRPNSPGVNPVSRELLLKQEPNIGMCSKWHTYGNNGGRDVLLFNPTQQNWKEPSVTPLECANRASCYPFAVSVEGVDVIVEPGIHSFKITSLFPRDEFHVALEGPELSPTFVEAHGDGTYTASYCVELPGLYKLHVRILQINGEVSLRKEIFASPFSVLVKGGVDLQNPISAQPNPIYQDACTNARQATQGRWVRFDHAKHFNLVPSFEVQKWEEVLEMSRDEYIWIPYSCRIRPMNYDDLKALFQNLSHCLCCDSYIRSLFSDSMLYLGIFKKKYHRHTRAGRMEHSNWEINGVSMAWHDKEYFEACRRKRPNGFTIENVLTEHVEPVTNHTTAEDDNFVFFVGHPWSGDHRRAHRTNNAVQIAQRTAFLNLGSDTDIFDAMGFAYPRIYHQACDGSHVSCITSGELTVLGFWEMLILAQLL